MIKYRELIRDEIELIRGIDRSEIIRGVYHYDKGSIRLEEVYQKNDGFPEEELLKNIKNLNHLLDSNGKIYGAFKENELIGMSALGMNPVGKLQDKLPLEILYTSQNSRGLGVGSTLMKMVTEEVIRQGYDKLYISATPTINTVDFYIKKGAVITKDPDPIILEIEWDDIHLELDLKE